MSVYSDETQYWIKIKSFFVQIDILKRFQTRVQKVVFLAIWRSVEVGWYQPIKCNPVLVQCCCCCFLHLMIVANHSCEFELNALLLFFITYYWKNNSNIFVLFYIVILICMITLHKTMVAVDSWLLLRWLVEMWSLYNEVVSKTLIVDFYLIFLFLFFR